MENKNSFLIYLDTGPLVDKLTNEQAGALFKAIFEYEESGILPELDAITDIVFTTIKGYLDRNRDKYSEICRKRSEAGKKGMAKRWNGITNDNKCYQMITNDNKAYQSITNITDSDSDNDSDNDNESESDRESERDIDSESNQNSSVDYAEKYRKIMERSERFFKERREKNV